MGFQLPQVCVNCNYTCGDLLFIQVCSEPAEKHCSTGLGKSIPYCSVVLCKSGSQQTCVHAIQKKKI